PIAVGLCLVVGCDLERERLIMLEHGAAVEPETRNADDCELHRQDIACLATRIIGRRLTDGGHFTIWKGRGVKTRRFQRILVETETDRIFRFHVFVLLLLDESVASMLVRIRRLSALIFA